jgi:CHAT domain-containing protein
LLSYARNATGTHTVATTSVRAIGFNGAQLKQAEAEALMLDAAAAVGENATGARFLELVAGNNPVHVAAHAAPGIDNPYFALIQLAGEDLYLHQLRGRTMSAPLLLLSACDTALAERLRSDQATTFATTLLENGVGAVIVTRWKIDDELTVPLMLDFYAELQAGRTPARALGAAQRAAVAEGGERAHPSFWAAFQVIGSP